MSKIALLLSGGVDSSYMAYLLKQLGHELVGIYLKLHDDESKHEINERNVKRIGEELGFETHIIDAKELFKKVVYDEFVRSYQNGTTPNPCALCNPHIKFGFGLQKALEFGCEFVATGHYARIEDGVIKEAKDESKDQSYFLFGLSQEAKERLIFPLGELIKEELKPIALKELPWLGTLESYKESQDVCFIKSDYIDILREHVDVDKKGEVKNSEGKVVGEHKGYMYYTVGKRRGFTLKVAHEPHYVLKTDPLTNTIIVGKKDELKTLHVEADNLSLSEDFQDGYYGVKVRYRSPKSRGFVKKVAQKIYVTLDEPVYGVASGQALVIYEDDSLVGGGWICK